MKDCVLKALLCNVFKASITFSYSSVSYFSEGRILSDPKKKISQKLEFSTNNTG